LLPDFRTTAQKDRRHSRAPLTPPNPGPRGNFSAFACAHRLREIDSMDKPAIRL
jgi:hypothetical protein